MEDKKTKEYQQNELESSSHKIVNTSKSSGLNWMEKLKPSDKNKLIMERYKNIPNLNQEKKNEISNNTKSPLKETLLNSSFNINSALLNSKTPDKKTFLNNDVVIPNNLNNNNINKSNIYNNNNFAFSNFGNQNSNSFSNKTCKIENINEGESNPNELNFFKDDNSKQEIINNLKQKNNLGDTLNISISEKDNKSYLDKWNKCVFDRRPTFTELNNINDQSQVIFKNNLDITVLSDDLENINNIMEERIKLNLYENGFLKQLYHSIIPFLLIQNKEVHRMCLSDYELKLFYKTYNKKKSESERKNPYESYRQGIIKFYKGKYLDAYSHFKSAHIKKESDLNISKWLAFTSLILLMCNKKIDFTNIKNVKVETNINDSEEKDSSDKDLIFPCCSSRKSDNKMKNLQNKNSTIKNNFIFNNGYNEFDKKFGGLNYYTSGNNSSNAFNFKISKISQSNLAKEILKLLKKLIKKENKNSNDLLTEKNEKNSNSNNLNIEDSMTHEEIKNVSHEVEAW